VDGQGIAGYAALNLVHDFDNTASLNASGTSITAEFADTLVEGIIGANLFTSTSTSLFVEAGYATSISGQDYTRFKGLAGIRVKF
jgi:outer membrane autotransporter protein